MLTPAGFVGRMAEWVAAFNRGSLDLPDRLIEKNAVFRLNGLAYEDTLGRPATDPLVRLMARGPAGYRLLAKAVQYALTSPEIALRDLDVNRGLATGHADVSGTLRDTGECWTGSADVALTVNVDGQITEVGLQMEPASVLRLQQARRG